MPNYEVIQNPQGYWVGTCFLCKYSTGPLSSNTLAIQTIRGHVTERHADRPYHPDEQEQFIARPTLIAHPCDHEPRCETPHRRDFMTRPKQTICAGCQTEGATVEGAWLSVRADFLRGVSVLYHGEVGTGRLMVFLCGAECLFSLATDLWKATIKRNART